MGPLGVGAGGVGGTSTHTPHNDRHDTLIISCHEGIFFQIVFVQAALKPEFSAVLRVPLHKGSVTGAPPPPPPPPAHKPKEFGGLNGGDPLGFQSTWPAVISGHVGMQRPTRAFRDPTESESELSKSVNHGPC